MKRHLANSPTLTMLGRIQEVHAFFRSRTRPDAGHGGSFQYALATAGLRTESCGRLLSFRGGPLQRVTRRPECARVCALRFMRCQRRPDTHGTGWTVIRFGCHLASTAPPFPKPRVGGSSPSGGTTPYTSRTTRRDGPTSGASVAGSSLSSRRRGRGGSSIERDSRPTCCRRSEAWVGRRSGFLRRARSVLWKRCVGSCDALRDHHAPRVEH